MAAIIPISRSSRPTSQGRPWPRHFPRAPLPVKALSISMGCAAPITIFLMDGLDNNAYSPSNQGYSSQVVQPSPDAIAQFKVITTNFSAEYGRVGGGIINAALRSGTNDFHGSAWEFLRNTDLNAI